MSERKAVLVTGATGGIGRALTLALAERGYTVYAGVRHDDPELAATPGVRTVRFDVTDEASVAAAAGEVRARNDGGGLRAVVNNAGVLVQGPVELVPADELRRQFEVNVYGPMTVIREFLPLLREDGRGRVVNVSAPTARVAMPMLGAISASKSALESLSDAARMELAPWGIPVSVVRPGAIRTRLWDKTASAADAALATADPARVALYRAALDATEKATAGQNYGPVDVPVKTIIKAIEARRPKPAYNAGREAAMAAGLLARLPTRLRDRLVTQVLGLRGLPAPASGSSLGGTR